MPPPQWHSPKTAATDGGAPYPHVAQNVDFKHPFYLVVLSWQKVGSCNNTSIVHQDGHIPHIFLHLLERKQKPKIVSVTQEKKKICKGGGNEP